MPHDELVACLDICLLTDEEFAEGEAAWSRYPDPFPTWQPYDPQ